MISAYTKATQSPQKEALYERVLLACAMAPTDELGYFAAADIRAKLSEIVGKPIDIPAYSRHLNDFSEPARGRILQKTGETRRFRFRFANPMMQPFVLLRGVSKGLYKPETEPETVREEIRIARKRRAKYFHDPNQEVMDF